MAGAEKVKAAIEAAIKGLGGHITSIIGLGNPLFDLKNA